MLQCVNPVHISVSWLALGTPYMYTLFVSGPGILLPGSAMGGRPFFLDAHSQDTPRARAPAGGSPGVSKVCLLDLAFGGRSPRPRCCDHVALTRKDCGAKHERRNRELVVAGMIDQGDELKRCFFATASCVRGFQVYPINCVLRGLPAALPRVVRA